MMKKFPALQNIFYLTEKFNPTEKNIRNIDSIVFIESHDFIIWSKPEESLQGSSSRIYLGYQTDGGWVAIK